MPAVNEAQRLLMGADLGRLRAGKKTRTGMSEAKLRHFAMKRKKKRRIGVKRKKKHQSSHSSHNGY